MSALIGKIQKTILDILGPQVAGAIDEPPLATLSRAIIDPNGNPLLRPDKNGYRLFTPPPAPVQGLSNVPVIAAGAGAGTGPTLSILTGGKDYLGIISLLTGSAPAASSAVGVVTFARPFGIAPIARIFPHNAAAAAIMAQIWADTETTTGFTLEVGATALTADTTYLFGYAVEV